MKVSWIASPWCNAQPDPSRRRVKPPPSHRAGLVGLGRLLKEAEGDRYSPAAVPVTAETLHALGDALLRIARGEDARHVFAQTATRGRQSRALEQQQIGAAYWLELLKGSTESAAVARAANHFPEMKLTRATVRQYAKPHARDHVRFMARHAEVTATRSPEQIAETVSRLLRRIERGAKRGTW